MIMENETAAVKLDTNKQIFSDEMLEQIAEAEEEMLRPGAEWHDAYETLREIREKYDL